MSESKKRAPKPLTFRETRVLEMYRALSEPTIERVARKGFPGKRPWTVADRIVRNALRRLVKLGHVERAGKGAYRVAATP